MEANSKYYKCNVIVCGPAIGKTYLAKHDKRFIDLDEMKADYKYGIKDATREEKEYGKLNRGKIINNDSTEYAIKILEREIKNNNIVLISSGNKHLLKYIVDNDIKYCLVYAKRELLDEYKERMIKRNNNEKFINKMTEKELWEKDYLENKEDKRPKYKIELESGKYLSDVKELFVR